MQTLPTIAELQAMYHAGNYAQVEACARKHLQCNERDPLVWNLLAAALASQGRLEESLILKRDIVGYFPEDPAALNNLGNALLQARLFNEAEAVLRRAIAHAPKLAVAHGNLGNALLEQGRAGEAEAVYREALSCAPRFVNAHYHLGLALHRQNRPLDAWRQWRAAADTAPGDVRFLTAASSVLLHLPMVLQEELAWLESRITEALLESPVPIFCYAMADGGIGSQKNERDYF